MLRVWMACRPFVLADALTALLKQQGSVEVLTELEPGERVDVAVFRLAATGELQDFFRGRPLHGTRLVVFSPSGEKAFIRERFARDWRVLQPFGLETLLKEVLAGSNQRS